MSRIIFPEFDEHKELALANLVEEENEPFSMTVDGTDEMNQYIKNAIEYYPLLLARYIAMISCINKLTDFMTETDSVPYYLKTDLLKAMAEVDRVFALEEKELK